MFDISLLPIFTSTVAAMVVGAAWYSPKLFGLIWMKEAGVINEGSPEGMWKFVLAGAMQNFVIIYILAHFMLLAEEFPGADPILAGVWMAILVAASHLGSVIWEKKSFSYFAINAGYLSLTIFMSALVIAKWPWA